MEDETQKFLVLIINTIALILIWMILHVFVGIYLGYAFFTENVTWKNLIYYIFLLATLFFVARRILKKWHAHAEQNRE